MRRFGWCLVGFLVGPGVWGCSRQTPVAPPDVGPQCPVCPPCAAVAKVIPTDAGDAASLKAEDGPETSMLFHLTDMYGPVKFNHKQHVGYADNCTVCHHHHSEVERAPACRECHGTAFKNLRRPGLKGAYHRQCMGCHRDMGSGPLGCEECHPKRIPSSPEELPPEKYLVADVVSLGHMAKEFPPLRFNHKLHTEMTDACKECHHHSGDVEKTPPCRECHNTRESSTGNKVVGLKDAYHQHCLACHRSTSGPVECQGCHQKEEAGKKK